MSLVLHKLKIYVRNFFFLWNMEYHTSPLLYVGMSNHNSYVAWIQKIIIKD